MFLDSESFCRIRNFFGTAGHTIIMKVTCFDPLNNVAELHHFYSDLTSGKNLYAGPAPESYRKNVKT
jgi:hypothetical protein